MARDPGLEEVLAEDLSEVTGLTTRPMFGGLAWMHHGRLLCAVRQDGMLVRLGPSGDLRMSDADGIKPMHSGPRPMRGWFWVDPAAIGRDDLRRSLLDDALAFVQSLPAKAVPLPAVPWDFPDAPTPSQSRPPRSRQKA